MKPIYYGYFIIGILFITLNIYYSENEYQTKIKESNSIEFYRENKGNYEITNFNYEKLKAYYNEEVFDRCYNGAFISCNRFKLPSNMLYFPDEYLNEGNDGKFLLGCLIEEKGLYIDCFCSYSNDKKCQGYTK